MAAARRALLPDLCSLAPSSGPTAMHREPRFLPAEVGLSYCFCLLPRGELGSFEWLLLRSLLATAPEVFQGLPQALKSVFKGALCSSAGTSGQLPLGRTQIPSEQSSRWEDRWWIGVQTTREYPTAGPRAWESSAEDQRSSFSLGRSLEEV